MRESRTMERERAIHDHTRSHRGRCRDHGRRSDVAELREDMAVMVATTAAEVSFTVELEVTFTVKEHRAEVLVVLSASRIPIPHLPCAISTLSCLSFVFPPSPPPSAQSSPQCTPYNDFPRH